VDACDRALGLIEMWIEDPDGIRIVPVEVPISHPMRRGPAIGLTARVTASEHGRAFHGSGHGNLGRRSCPRHERI